MQGLGMQLEKDGRLKQGSIGLVIPDEEGDHMNDKEGMYGEFHINISGEALRSEGVRKARVVEMQGAKRHNLYTKVPIKECRMNTGKKPIGVRWVDVDKGDSTNCEYRSRLVAKGIDTEKREDLFAATPPLEAKKALFSMAVTEGIGFRKGDHKECMKLIFIDVRRAFFHVDARRSVYIEHPEED